MSGVGVLSTVRKPWDLPKERRGKHSPERGQILLMTLTGCDHVVGYPARQTQPGLLNGLCR